MRIIVSTSSCKTILHFFMDSLIGISAASKEFAAFVIRDCDLIFQEGYIPGLGKRMYRKRYPDAIAVCPRTEEAYNNLARHWHDVIGRLLPHRLKTIDYDAYHAAMKAAGYDEQAVMRGVTGVSFFFDLMEELTEGAPLVAKPKIQMEEYEVFHEYRRSLFTYVTDCYPTLDLWSPTRSSEYVDTCKYLRLYSIHFGRKGLLRLHNVGRLTPIIPISELSKLAEVVFDRNVTLEKYQEFHIEAEGAGEKEDKERIAEFEAQIDYTLIPSEEDVRAGAWIPRPEDITRSQRISEFLKFGTEYEKDKLKKGDTGKPPLWDSIWLYFNSEGEQSPLTENEHTLLNNIICEKIGDNAACWLFEVARHWSSVEPDDEDEDEYDEEYIQKCLKRANSFSSALKNLCLHNLVIVEAPVRETHGVINLAITERGLEMAILEAEEYSRKHGKDYYDGGWIKPLHAFVSQYQQVRDWYIKRGIYWTWTRGKGWFISPDCREQAIALKLEHYLPEA